MNTLKAALLIAFVVLSPVLYAQQTTPWKGFEKVHFDFKGHKAWYVRPAVPLEGKPWVWRAHFPDWHTDMDSILVSRGFYIAYVNTNDLFGHPSALRVWNDFYEHMTTSLGLSDKVALEAVSRGGLYAYGWAKRNPDKVSCIYAEAPVCDPRSWPGGKGEGKGSPKDWEKWLTLFGLTDAESAEFNDIPLNDLEGLAAYKVPVLHVVGPKDQVVPNEENTFRLVQNYSKAGGPTTVYTLSRGQQKSDGHHFPIEHPEVFANFIQQHSYPVKKRKVASAYVERNGGLSESMRKFEETKKGTVAFLGGSITFNPGWRTKTIRYLEEQYPGTEFTFISAGISSLGSTPHAFRFSRDVLAHGTPDLLFVESAVNDRANGFSKTAQIRALEGIVRHARKVNPEMDIVMMAFADPDKSGDWDSGQEPVEVGVHSSVAKHYGLPFINLAREVYDRIQSGEFSWKYDFKDLHPSPFGQEIYFNTIRTLLRQSGEESSRKTNPKPLDPFSYAGGRYLDIRSATNLEGFRYVENWKPADGKGTRSGFVDVPVLVGEAEGASFELSFSGKAIGIAVVSGPDAGVVTYRINGRAAKQVDLKTEWSNQLHLPWYVVLDDELKPGKHKLTLTLEPAKDAAAPTACRIVHFLVAE